MPRKHGLRKYVQFDDTDGGHRFYFRKRGQQKIRLPDEYNSQEFVAAYMACLAGAALPEERGPARVAHGTLRWLCDQYYQSAEYKLLDARTRRVRSQILAACCKEATKPNGDKQIGDMPLSHFTVKTVRTIRDRKAEKPEAANSRVKALRQVFAWAIKPDVDLFRTNPARDIAYFRGMAGGFHSWTIDEVEQFEERHAIGTKARLAMALLLYTSQRRSDVVLFGKQHCRNGVLRFTQQKNRNRNPIKLELPIHPRLQEIINASPCGDMTFLVTEFGNGFTANGFGNWFRKRCNEAGLPHCSAHGLRKAAATRMADKGASEHQIMSVTGHQTSKEVTRYTKAARQRVLARSAVEMLGDDPDEG
ncbi:MAG: tyrosine-type recombinase/integrase [Rhizobiaceae bacterium]